jgi:hypothetical protein
MNLTTFAIKQETLYVAYAPEFDVAAYGACRDEALNNLTEQLLEQGSGNSTGEERKNEIRS